MTNTMTQPTLKIRINNNNTMDMDIKWSDIVFVNFGENEGSEQGGERPAIIIQNNKGNSASPCTLVALITSKHKHNLPTHITLYPDNNNGLTKVSTIMCEQITTIDKSRILYKLGHIETEGIANRILNSLSIAFSKNYC